MLSLSFLCRASSYPLELLLSNFQTVCSRPASTQAPFLHRRKAPQALHRLLWCHQSVGRADYGGDTSEESLVNCTEAARADSEDIVVVPEFISSEEEQSLLQDVSRTLRGKKYQYKHWDGAIEGYRETEKSQWTDENLLVIERLKVSAINAVPGRVLTSLPEVHVLDLAEDGYIKPHIDSVKFCGEVIAGLSLLSPSVMQMQHEEDDSSCIQALLPRRSLYIMRGVVRYRYTHAILVGERSHFLGLPVPRERRVSIICRTLPEKDSISSKLS